MCKELLLTRLRWSAEPEMLCLQGGSVISRHTKVKNLISMRIELTLFLRNLLMHAENREVY